MSEVDRLLIATVVMGGLTLLMVLIASVLDVKRKEKEKTNAR